MTRAAIFDAVRDQVPDVWGDPGNIHAMDNLLDALGVPRGDARREINDEGLKLIKLFEGLELVGYLCPAGVPTIGYGHTGGVKVGQVITEAQAEDLLRSDLRKFEDAVFSMVGWHATDNQFSALVSFAYNVGAQALKNSTLLKMHNSGAYEEAARQFARWNKAGGQPLAGLTRRRNAEAALYRRPVV